MVVALLVLSVLINVALIYSAIITVRKLEWYEDRVITFYEDAQRILIEARRLDRREMFENDDDVGILFQQLLDIIGQLRKLIYDTEETEEEKSLLDPRDRESYSGIQHFDG